MNTCELYGLDGKRFDLFNPRSVEISPKAIAVPLSRLPRWGGRTRADQLPYSVAQHCVMAADLAPERFKLPALLHDAHEAFLGDVPAPLLKLPECDALRDLAKRWDAAIAEAFGLDPRELYAPQVIEADLAAREVEERFLIRRHDPAHRLIKLDVWPPGVAAVRFLEMLNRLLPERTHAKNAQTPIENRA